MARAKREADFSALDFSAFKEVDLG